MAEALDFAVESAAGAFGFEPVKAFQFALDARG
jgi:hypothetical protein